MINETIKNFIKDRTLGMFSEEWYQETSDLLSEKIDGSNRTGYVYFLRSLENDKIKIGSTINVQKRLNSIKSYVGDILLIGIVESDMYKELEKYFHEIYKQKRVHGEWFEISDYSSLYENIRKHGGHFYNRKFNNNINIYSDIKITEAKSCCGDIPLEVFEFLEFNCLFKEGKYNKKDLYDRFPNNIYSKRLFTSFICKYIISKGMKYKEQKSGSDRNIIVFF